jgi:hypothetical protein
VEHTAGESPELATRRKASRTEPNGERDGLAENIEALQHIAGNRAVATLMRARDDASRAARVAVARDPAPPAAATAETAAAETSTAEPELAPAGERGAVAEHPPAHRPGFDLAGGQEILTGAFGTIKKIVPGKIEVLDEADFQVAYDKIYGAGDYSWAKYVVPKYGSLNGFAYKGTNYINKASAGLHTIVHEMLHNNCAADFIDVVGSRFNEGTTEILTQVACALFNEPAPVTYPGESPVVQTAVDNGLPLADLQNAYLVGGAKKLIADWVDANCVLTWAQFKVEMEANRWAAAKAGLAIRTAVDQTPAGDGPTSSQPSSSSGAGTGSQSG